jgi:hypothetical protein
LLFVMRKLPRGYDFGTGKIEQLRQAAETG